MSDYLYTIGDTTALSPSNENFCLHTHSAYEIFFFLEGDAKYIVEEKQYDLAPGDIIIIRKNEMHRIFHNSNKKYRRIVIMVTPEFFRNFGCDQYENAFLSQNTKLGNKINAQVVHSSGLYDAVMRLKKYTNGFKNMYTPIANGIMVEMMYLMNQISLFENAESTNKIIENVINYINNHFTEKITLDMLCDKFFVSKYYLCHIFKESTGLTVHEYVKQKRLTLATDYVSEGKTLTEAALLSGFTDYSSFYRAYTKEHKQNPKKKI